MSFYDFSAEQYVKTIDTSETIRMGSFQVATSLELAHIRILLFIHGVTSLGGSEQVRLKIYTDQYYESSTLLYTSSWATVSDITNLGVADWIGWITIDFDRENLNKNQAYYVLAEFQNYTRNSETFYFGLSHDFPWPIYDNSENLFYDHPLAMAIFGYKERS